MRTLRLALVALVIAVSALSSSPALCAEAPEVINNKKTVLHKNFFDIPVALVPKMGYDFEKIEGGVVDKKQKVSLEGTLLHMPYSRLIDEISHDALKKGGMEVKSRYSFIWNGSRAELMKIFAGGRGGTIGKWVLIVDRGADKCWMISGSYNSKDMRSAQFVLDMIRSEWWENGGEGRTAGKSLLGPHERRFPEECSMPFLPCGAEKSAALHAGRSAGASARFAAHGGGKAHLPKRGRSREIFPFMFRLAESARAALKRPCPSAGDIIRLLQ